MRWVEDKTETLARELHAGRLDAALLALEADLGGPLQREVIGRDRFVLATPRKHPLAKRSRPANLGELRGAHLLLLDDGHCLRDQALAVCAGARTEELAFRATSLPTLAQMVSAGAGITLLPRMAVATESRRADLAVRPHGRRARVPDAGAGVAADVAVGPRAAAARRDDPRELREDGDPSP